MFFLIAGVQPRIRTIDTNPHPCPRCGLHQAYLRRVDHYFSLFFIPLICVKKGTPYLYCRHCERPDVQTPQDEPAASPRSCPRCGALLDPGFSYCPHCGQRQ
jgi:hypothetical protein